MNLTIQNNTIKSIIAKTPGLALCLAIALVAYGFGNQFPLIGGPVTGIILGIVVGTFSQDRLQYESGITFSSKKVLQWAVILLGFKLNFSAVIKMGLTSLPVILSTITTALLMAFILHKLLKTRTHQAILIGVGSCICGGSAIAASSSVIDAKKEDIVTAMSVIFLFNIIAALIFPTLGNIMHLSNEGFALFAGSAVNDTSSVTATAASWDSIHGSNILGLATIVKLTRTLAIIPITLVLGIVTQRKTGNQKFNLKKIFPTFIIYFLIASIVTTLLPLPDLFITTTGTLSKIFIIMAMSAIGLNTDIKKLLTNAKKPILMGFIIWISIIAVCLTSQNLLHLV